MKSNINSIIIVLILGAMSLLPFLSYADDNSTIDVVLVVDSSGSMKKTDPQSLRIPAAKLFISLLDDSDRAGLISFSDKGYPLISLTHVDSEENRDKLFKAVDRISSDGLHTNLYDALYKGLSVLSSDRRKDSTQFIIIMSDGMMDVGNPDEDRRLLDKMKNELAALLEGEEVKVYAIAFTEQSDRLLLEKISKQTGGFYNLALTDKDFHLIFSSIFESLKRPDMLPMSNNGFLVDGSIEEVTIVATKGSPETKIQINAPDGQHYTNKGKATGIEWFVSNSFDMITVEKPAGGRWEILFSSGENNKAYIITNLKLQTNFEQLYSTFGDPLEIKIWLEKEGTTIAEQNVLDKIDIYVELTGPDGKTSKLTPFSKEEGIFVRKVAPFTPGNYKLRIVAHGNTFEREKAFVFNVADAIESKADILAEREKKKNAEKQSEIEPGDDNIADGVSWGKVILQFVAINCVLGVIVLVYFRRTKLKTLISINRMRGLTTRKKDEGDHEEEKGEEGEEDHHKEQNQQDQINHGKPDEQVKQKESEGQIQNEAVDEKKNQEEAAGLKEDEQETPPEQQAGHAENDEQKQEIALEEKDDKKDQEVPEEKAERKENEEDQQEIPLEEEDLTVAGDTIKKESTDNNSDHQEYQTDSNEQILNQEDLNQVLAMGDKKDITKEKAEQDTDMTSDVEHEVSSKLQSDPGNEINKEDLMQDEQEDNEENLDDLWQEALKTQKDAEGGKEDIQELDEQKTALNQEIERLEKINTKESSAESEKGVPGD